LLGGQTRRWNLTRRPTRPHRVHLDQPRRELLGQVGRELLELARPEEAPFDEADEILDGALLLRLARGAELDREAVVDGGGA